MILLSILVPCLPEPESQKYLSRLLMTLQPQVDKHANKVELIINSEPRTMSTGAKRNAMIDACNGIHFSQIDCDDVPAFDYVDRMLKAIESNPDVVTFNGWMTTDHINRRNFTIKLGEKYEERNGHYYRYPNHLCCFKKEVVKSVRFQNIWIQEDYLWATDIKNKRLLKTEVHIDADMYHYDFVSKKKTHIPQALQSRARR